MGKYKGCGCIAVDANSLAYQGKHNCLKLSNRRRVLMP